MSHRRFIAAGAICSALALQLACAVGRAIRDTIGAMASGEPPRDR